MFEDHDEDGKVKVSKPKELLGAASAAKSMRTQEEAIDDVEEELVDDDKLKGSKLG